MRTYYLEKMDKPKFSIRKYKIEEDNFDEAYSRYKNSVLALENQFVKPVKQQPHVKKLILS